MSQRHNFTRVLWACLGNPIKIIASTCKTFIFTSTQNINFVSQFFKKILQRYCRLIILSTLGMSAHTHQNKISPIYRKLWCSSTQKFHFVSHFLLEYHKNFEPLLFWEFGHAWLCPPRLMVSTCKFDVYLQKIIFIPPFFSEILHRCHKLAILGSLGISNGTNFWKPPLFIHKQKLNLIPRSF